GRYHGAPLLHLPGQQRTGEQACDLSDRERRVRSRCRRCRRADSDTHCVLQGPAGSSKQQSFSVGQQATRQGALVTSSRTMHTFSP
ncbi:unnamed protein product, partial [Ectocarpus fasciculatus]